MASLFSYGTLQLPDVQLATFGRLLNGLPDILLKYEESVLEIKDPAFVAASGKTHHAIIRYTGRIDSRVLGTVFEVTTLELEKSDRYEPAGYCRVSARLASGTRAWVYAAVGTLTDPLEET